MSVKPFFIIFIFFFIGTTNCYNFYIRQNFTPGVFGDGSISKPYAGIVQAFLNISSNTTLINLFNTGIDKTFNFILMSDFYIIKSDDFNGAAIKTYPYRVLSQTNAITTIMPLACFNSSYYPYNLDNCPSNTTVEIIYKTELMRIDVRNSWKIINIRITGRDLNYLYNASSPIDSSCYLTREGCCKNDSYFINGTSPNSKCVMINIIVKRTDDERTPLTNSMFYLTYHNGSFNLTNFELAYMNSYNYSTKFAGYYAFICDYANNTDKVYFTNFTLNWTNCTFKRTYLRNRFVYMRLLKSGCSFYFNNILFIDLNFYNILEWSSGQYYGAKASILLFNQFYNTSIILDINNITLINTENFLKVQNVNATIRNCQLWNFSRPTAILYQNIPEAYFMTVILVSYDWSNAFVSFTNEFSNIRISNISIYNYYNITYNYGYINVLTPSVFFGLHGNVFITNITIDNVYFITFYTNYVTPNVFAVYGNTTYNIFNITVSNYRTNCSLIVFYKNVTGNIRDLYFTNIATNGIGGIFRVLPNNSLTISNSTLINITVTGFSNKDTIQTYTDNTQNFPNQNGKGGVIYVYNNTYARIFNLTITNGALPNGEGFVGYAEGFGLLEINYCMISNITASRGSIVSGPDNTSLLIVNSTIKGICSAGILLNHYSTLHVKYSRFLSSTYLIPTEFGMISGFSYCNITLENSLLQDIAWNTQGGLFYGVHYNFINFTGLTIKNFYITQNYGMMYTQGNDYLVMSNCVHQNVTCGAIMYNFGFNGFGYTYNNSFIDCYIFGSTDYVGGVFYVAQNSTMVMNFTYIRNMTILSPSFGGLVYLINSFLNMSNLYSDGSYSQTYGGIIYGDSVNTIFVSNVVINGGLALAGGFVYLNSMNNFKIENVTVLAISSIQDGACFYVNQGNNFQLNYGIFINLCAHRYGSLLATSKKNNVTIFDIEVYNSTAGSFNLTLFPSIGEAAIIFIYDISNVTVFNLYVRNVTSERKGGSFSLFGGNNNFTVVNATIIDSKVLSGNGGFLSTSGNTGNNYINLLNLNVSKTFANNSGGLFSFEDQFNIILINNSYFYDSFAKFEFGGGFSLGDQNSLFLFNDSFIKQVSNIQGGFIYADIINTINITSCYMGNTSTLTSDGGFIFLVQSNYITIRNSNFSYISSAFDGGAFLLYNENILYLISCIFMEVSAVDNGGLISSFKLNQAYLNDSQLFNVIATFQGSIIYMSESNVFIMNCSNITNLKSNGNKSSLFESAGYSNLTITYVSFNLYQMLSIIPLSIQSFGMFINNTFTRNSSSFTVFELSNSVLNVKYITFDFSIPKYFLNAKNSVFNFTFCSLNTKDAITTSMLYFLQCSVFLHYTSFSKNTFNYYNMIYAENSNVSITNSIAFGMTANDSGAFLSLKNSFLKSKRNLFLANRATVSGGVLSILYDIPSNFSISIKKSIFISNIGYKYGGSIYFLNKNNSNNQSITLEKSKFVFNQGFQGGTINVINSINFSLFDCLFKRNIARNGQNQLLRAKGGAIYYYNENNAATYQRISTNFIENKAEIGGASYSEGVILPLVLNNQYIQNKGSSYGNDDATDTKSLSFYQYMDQGYKVSVDTVNNIQSGNYYNTCLSSIIGFDEYNNQAYNSDEDYLRYITITQLTSLYSNRFNFSIQNGSICFHGSFKRNQLPIEYSFRYSIQYKNLQNKLNLTLNFRNCQVGERLTDDRTCEPCALNTYSFVTDFTVGTTEKCLRCDESNNFYCFGKNHLTSRAGYWRLNEYSTNFIKCKNSACLGDIRQPSITDIADQKVLYDARYSTSQCAVGYTGILCNECDKNFGHIDQINCLECGSSTYNMNLIVQLLLRVLFTVYSVYQEYIMVCSICSSDIDKNEVITTSILKTFVNHMQVLSIISAFPFEWPSDFSFSVGLFLSFSPNVSEGLSLECILKSGYFNISVQYFKLIICAIYPFILVFLSIIFIKIAQSIKKDKMKFLVARKSTITRKRSSSSPTSPKSPKIKESSMSYDNLDKYIKYSWVLVSIFLCILILCFPDIIKVILSMFACANFGDSLNVEERLISDYTIVCYTKSHNLWTYFFAVPFLVLIGLVFPAVLMLKMSWAYYKNKMEQRDREILLKYGFFFFAYKSKLFFWDLVILMRKLMLLFINIFYMSVVDVRKDLTPVLLVFLVLVISVLLQYHFNPFDEQKFGIVNHVESTSLSCLVATVLSTLFYFGQTSVGQSFDVSIVLFLVFVTIVVNVFFLMYFIRAFYLHNIKIKIQQVKKKSELLFSKLRTMKSKFQFNSMWTSFTRKFSSKSNSPDLPLAKSIMAKSKARVISLFKSTYDVELKKELISPLKKFSTDDKKEQQKIMFILKEILIQRGKQDSEKYNLLYLEQQRFKKKILEKTNTKQISEIDEIPEEKGEKEEILNPQNSDFVQKIYNNKYYYNLACLNETHILIANSLFSIKSKTKLKQDKLAEFYLKIQVEVTFKEVVDQFTYEMTDMNGNKLFYINLYSF